MSALSVSTRRDIHAEAPAERKSFLCDAFFELRDELSNALLNDPSKLVRTPAYGDALGGHCAMPAEEVLYEAFSEKDGDALLHEVVSILGEAANSGSLRAQLLISNVATRHAKYHADDYASSLAADAREWGV